MKSKKMKQFEIVSYIIFTIAIIVLGNFLFSAWDINKENNKMQIIRGIIQIPDAEKPTTGKKSVSINTSNYFKKVTVIETLIAEWQKSAYEDLTTYGEIQLKYYTEKHSNIFKEIDELKELSINELSAIKPYEIYANEYYKTIKEFIKSIDEKGIFDTHSFNEITKWREENTSTFDYIVSLMEENGFEYSIVENEETREMRYTYSGTSLD